MLKKYSNYIIGAVLLIFAIILIIIGFNLVRSVFGGDTPAEQQTTAVKKVDLLAAPTANQAIQYTVHGPVVGNEDRRGVRITIDRTIRKVEVLQGYNDVVIKTQQTPNTQEAYQALVVALNGAGFVSNVAPEGRGDEAQSCPLGQKFSYELAPGSNTFRSWSNSCSSKQGTFSGNRSLIETLMQKQIPDYNEFITDVKLS